MNTIIWNLKIRILHWLMALFIVINLFIFDEGGQVHEWIGYGTLVFVFFRTIIGIVSQGNESFFKFPLQPHELLYFIKNIFNSNRKDYEGHNPAASYAYLGFWILVLGLGTTGIMLVQFDQFFGNEFLEELHELMADGVILFLIVHFSGIILDSVLHRRKSWMSIITGRK